MSKLIQKTVKIKRVFFDNTNFSAGLFVDNQGETNRFAGKLFARKERNLTVCGNFETTKYGKQFIVDHVKPDVEINLNGLAKYLSIRPDVKGVGLSKAETIVAKFGLEFEKKLLSETKKIATLAKVEESSFVKLKVDWQESAGWNQVYSWLASFDLTYFQIKIIVKRFGSESVFLLKEDPYALIDKIPGIGFLKMDEIALKLGFDKNFPGRLQGSLLHSLKKYLKRGHCWVEGSDLQKHSMSLLQLEPLESEEVLEATLKNAINNEVLYSHSIGQQGFAVGLSHIAEYEQFLADRFKNHGYNPHKCNFEHLIDELSLNDMQKTAVFAAMENNLSVISGGAGTGKTYTTKAIAHICKANHFSVQMAAPTGKAARRIEEATGVEAFTLHRLLGYDGRTFEHARSSFEISSDFLVIDEVSMVDIDLFWHLFQSINLLKTSLVLVGDHNQLPPVGPGNVLRDLMAARPIAITVLTEVVRQAGTLKRNSLAVLDGEIRCSENGSKQSWYVENHYEDPLQIKNRIIELFEHRFEDLGFHILNDVQILSPTHKGPIGAVQLNFEIRRIIQKKLFNVNVPECGCDDLTETPKVLFLKNDKVIQTVNDYDNNVMNGEIGLVTKVEKPGNVFVKFNGHKKIVEFRKGSKKIRTLQLAYCLSIHKVQGSHFPCVVSIVHRSHSFMHHRNMLYTAVTRAEKTTFIVGDAWGVQNCADRIETTRRRTFLRFFMPALDEPNAEKFRELVFPLSS